MLAITAATRSIRIGTAYFIPDNISTAALMDDLWLSVGSANFDIRSFSLNHEVNLNVVDADLARHQIEWFEPDKARSHEIKLGEWSRRPLRTKLRGHAVSWLHSQL